MNTKSIFGAVLIMMCVMTANVNGQNSNETPQQKYERLAKAADADPTNWEKQLEAGHFLLDKEQGMYDMLGAMKYYERIYHMVADVNRVVPDSVFVEAGISLMFTAMNQQDLDQTMFYGDELNRYTRLIKDKESTVPLMVNTMAVVLEMAKERNFSAGQHLQDVRAELSRREFKGIEHTEMVMATLYEQTLTDYQEFAKNKLMEVDIDGKTYVLIAKGNWNVEQPFMGWMSDGPNDRSIFYGPDGKVYDDLHGQIVYNFHWSDEDKGVVKSDDTNTRLVTVTPERRQQMIEAYKKYLKK